MKLASAPVTWGVWERTAERGDLPPSAVLLEAVAGLGYVGMELGPLGYFGTDGSAVRGRLDAAGLELAGGFLELHLTDRRAFEADLPLLNKTLTILEGSPATLILADAGSPERRRASGQMDELRRTTLDRDAFACAMERLRRALDRSMEAGVQCAFHPHAATYVESADETERLLEVTEPELGICLDTGHATIGGADPLQLADMLGKRLVHLHLKDVDGELRARIAAGQLDVDSAWEEGLFCPFGEGEVDLEGFLALPDIRSYAGWVVLEQDRVAVLPDIEPIIKTERANRDRVLAWCQSDERGNS